MNLQDQIELDIASSGDMVERVSYSIWGAIATTTRGFGKVEIKIEPKIKRVFAKVEIRWMVNHKKMNKIHAIWLKRAEVRAKEYVPEGWSLLVYYGNQKV